MKLKDFLDKTNCTREDYSNIVTDRLEFIREKTTPNVASPAWINDPPVNSPPLKNCISELKTNGMVLHFISENKQTEEMCLIAVNQNGLALRFVVNQTIKICEAAVKQNKKALEFVDYMIIEEMY